MYLYLSGAIEYAPDGGKAWRSAITPVLAAAGYEVYDPASDERKNLTEDEMRNFRAWKRSNLDRFRETIRKIMDYDLDLIEHQADAVLAYWDEFAAQGAGSHGELTVACRRGIPVYLVLGMPVERVSGWILGCATHIFRSFAEAEHYFRAAHAARLAAASATPVARHSSIA